MAIEPGDVQEGVELPSLAVMDALRATFALYRRHFLTVVLTMGLLALPGAILPSLVDFSLNPPAPFEGRPSRTDLVVYFAENVGAGLFGTVARMAVFDPLDALVYGASSLLAVSLVLGRPAGVPAAYGVALRQLVNLTLSHFLMVGLFALCFITCIGLLAVPYMMTGLEFMTQAVVLERRGPIGAMRRSWAMARGQRWRIFWCQLLVSLPVLIEMLLFFLERWWLVGDWKGSQITSLAGYFRAESALQISWLIELGLTTLSILFFAPLSLIMSAVLYLDLRARERPYHLPIRPSPDEGPSG